MDELKRILSEIGLSNYKIEVYITLLSIRYGTVQQIAKHCKVPACKIYENLKWLNENGYITQISQKPLSYRANNPESVIKSEIEEKKEKMENLKKDLEKIKLNFPAVEKDIIQITTTREGYFKKVKESVKEAKDSILYTAKHWRVDAELVRLLEQKVKEGVVVRALGPVSKDNQSINWLKEAGIEIKNFDLKETHFSVYDKSLIIISLRKESKKSDYSAVWFKSETLGKILADHFDNLWKNA
jgi:sugar-specific transcriptional regulator TrmB